MTLGSIGKREKIHKGGLSEHASAGRGKSEQAGGKMKRNILGGYFTERKGRNRETSKGEGWVQAGGGRIEKEVKNRHGHSHLKNGPEGGRVIRVRTREKKKMGNKREKRKMRG